MTEEVGENVFDSLSDIEKHYTIFAGSSEDDVAYAKVFWSSLFLQPPLESRLVSADIRQRLKVAKVPQTTNAAHKLASWPETDDIQHNTYLKQKQEEKQRYMEMAKKRDQIIDLLKRLRNERIKKEMISLQHKSQKGNPERLAPKTLSSPLDEDHKEVMKLQ
ncbi:cilia- and flagella-associated protein HOATZ [Triplophysa dalaica]|uniref:cilia- and flagella-associated protein HOATZ n=1 Tax=Triplophysa dalaica TaxID=1582913 RepID=UPI0024DF4990|nr:cilia- and flagella-associated protein HOATZ [Triplophysa dalaica]